MTQEHIDKGAPFISGFCPLALALLDATKDEKFGTVYVGNNFVSFSRIGGFFTLPDIGIAFVHDFDNKAFCQPFEFEIVLWLDKHSYLNVERHL